MPGRACLRLDFVLGRLGAAVCRAAATAGRGEETRAPRASKPVVTMVGCLLGAYTLFCYALVVYEVLGCATVASAQVTLALVACTLVSVMPAYVPVALTLLAYAILGSAASVYGLAASAPVPVALPTLAASAQAVVAGAAHALVAYALITLR